MSVNWYVPRRIAAGAVGALAGVFVLVGSSSAAAPPTPTSLSVCGGALAPDPTGAASQQPDRLTYRFSCDTDISAYTILFNRPGNIGGNLDDYNPAPSVVGPDGVTPSATQSIACAGTTPSDGINCNLGAGGVMSTGNNAIGSIDPTGPYCKTLPAKAKPGTRAIPQGLVQLIVTDNTGAEDGPFVLRLSKACPKVPDVVPTPKPKAKPRHKTTKTTRARSRRQPSHQV